MCAVWCICLSAASCWQVVYFRANKAGACDYVNDSRYWRYSHGTCWSELAEDLLVVDVPGDHFSLLRQDPPDMEVSGAELGVSAGGNACAGLYLGMLCCSLLAAAMVAGAQSEVDVCRVGRPVLADC